MKNCRNTEGSVLVLSLLLMSVLLMIGGILLSLTLTNFQAVFLTSSELITEYIAKAGIARTIHDLKENYSDHDQQLIEVEFGEGKYRIGTVTLVGQGIHEILIVSEGIKMTGQIDRVAIGARVKIDTPTDYTIFSEGDEYLRIYPGSSSIICTGPIHVNGSLYLRFAPYPYTMTDPRFLFIVKPTEVKGPTISTSNRIIYEGGIDTVGGLGTLEYPWQKTKLTAGIGKVTPSDIFDIKYEDIRWEGKTIVFGEATGMIEDDTVLHRGRLIALDHYPKNVITGPMPDITGDGILNDGEHGGYIIRVPRKEEITEETFKGYIDPAWKIENLQFTQVGTSKIGFANDAIERKEIIGPGKWDGSMGSINDSSMYTFNYSPPNREIKHLYYVRMKSNTIKYKDGTPVVAPARDLDPTTSNKWTVYTLDPPGTPDDTFTASKGTLTIKDANTWKKYHLTWFSSANMYAGYHADKYSFWKNAGEEKTIRFTDGVAMDREIRDFRFNTDYPLDSSEYYINKVDDEYSGSCTVTIAHINPEDYTFNANGVDTRFKLKKYHWVSWSPDGTGKNNAVKVNGVTQSEAPYYYGGNEYYDPSTGVPLTAGQQSTFLAGYDYHRYWDSSTNEFYVEFSTPPPNGVQILVTSGKWWFPRLAGGESPNNDSLQFRQYPPRWHTLILTDPYIEAIQIDLNSITKYTCPKSQLYPLGFADYNKNGVQDANEPGKYGVIYSKVPLVIKGTPKVPVTIVSEEDIYLQNINSEYPEDSPEVFPVGIVSRKVVWVLHGNENTKEAREVILNKVAIFTGGDSIFDYGGIGEGPMINLPIGSGWISNKTKFIGSLWKSKVNSNGENTVYKKVSNESGQVLNKIEISQQEPYVYIYDNNFYRNGNIITSYRYAPSFRSQPPPHFPIDFKTINLKMVMASSTENFFNKLSPYIVSQENITPEVYQLLLNEMEK